MSSTVISTGKLLVGQTTREKSLTHRLPRGVFARDDEGGIQIADGVTPGGHNPLKRRTKSVGIIKRFSYDPFSDYIYLYLDGTGILDTESFKLEYKDTEGVTRVSSTVVVGRGGRQGFYYPEDIEADGVVVIYHVDSNLERTDLVRQKMNDLKLITFTRSDTMAETFRVESFTVPLPNDHIELAPAARTAGAIVGLTLSEGEYTGAFFSTIDPLLSYANPIGSFTTIPFTGSAGRDYVICDKDIFSDSYPGKYFILSYDKDTYDNCKFDIYDESANLSQTIELGSGLYHFHNSYPFDGGKPAALYSKLGYLLVVFSGRKFVLNLSDVEAFSNGTAALIEEETYATVNTSWMSIFGEIKIFTADRSSVAFDEASPMGMRDYDDRTLLRSNSSSYGSFRRDLYGDVSIFPRGLGLQYVSLAGETLNFIRYWTAPDSDDAITYTKTAEELFSDSGLKFNYDNVEFGLLINHKNGSWQQELYVTRGGKTVIFDFIIYGNTVRPMIPIDVSLVDVENRFLGASHNGRLYDMHSTVNHNGFLIFTNGENRKIDVYVVRSFTYA